ncbi:axonemal dynein light intermediate polypeptide 1-like isoform X2 [Nelusetta ayraudi]|uniref:axonemal dynein light intermediate polypeptide 1-like isoform X2 n=1 Tax=Nelusetta ayraudi TaxID=303726 RepID=UPI003F706F7F
MIPPAESLLKYGNPILVNKHAGKKSSKRHSLNASPLQAGHFLPSPPPPKDKPASTKVNKQDNEDILNAILPPRYDSVVFLLHCWASSHHTLISIDLCCCREWVEGNKQWIQAVSSAVSTRTEVIQLEELLDTKIQQRQARETGICPIRRELYSQCFDELIRQVTINCAERGLLLLRVRDELQMTLAAYQTLYESSVAFGMRKALQAEQGKSDMEKRIADLESEREELKKQLDEQRAKCEAIEKRENEKQQLEEKKHNEEIQFLKETNQQLKAQLEGIFTLKK